jgi:hypothetical protein
MALTCAGCFAAEGPQQPLYNTWGRPWRGRRSRRYLPKSKILVSADIKRLKLDVTQHVRIHGNPSSNADFERTVGPAAARARPAGEGG